MTNQQQTELKRIKRAASEVNLIGCLREMAFWNRFNDELSAKAHAIYRRRHSRLRAKAV